MVESHVVSGLVAKRGELAGEAERHRRELHRLADELVHLEATIRLFAPDYDLGGIRVRRRRHRHQWFKPGECQRLVLEVLRDAPGPLSDHGVRAAVAVRKGLQDRPEVLASLHKTTQAVLRRLAGKGVARAVGLADGGRAWERA
jgi:hypothetical protein